MSPAAYIPNPGFEKEFADENPGFLEEAGRGIAEEANRIAPRIMPAKAQAVEVQVDGGVVLVVNTDYGGHLAEWGSKNNPATMPLRRAVRAKGYRLTGGTD